MLRPPLFAPLAGALLSLACSQALAAASPYSTLIVFGDSLVDAGQFPDGVSGATLRFTYRSGPTFQGNYGQVSPTLLGTRLGVAPHDLNASTSSVRAAQGLATGTTGRWGAIAPPTFCSPSPRFPAPRFHLTEPAAVPSCAAVRATCQAAVDGRIPMPCICCPAGAMIFFRGA